MLSADILSFQEFMNREPLPVATLHNAIFEFLRDRRDVVLFGAQAVNAYTEEPRMTQDIDLMALQGAELAEALRVYLSDRFYIAMRVQEVKSGLGYRLYQVRKTGNRHLADIRQVETLPAYRSFEGMLVMEPATLIASKVIAYYQRRGKPKAGTDWRDLALLLLKFPELKVESGSVLEQLQTNDIDKAVLRLWQEIVETGIQAEDEDDDF
ncbi:MAG: nucleotidyl transferase AbiEii/AbiGii toxin family protein [Cyanobacteria bacterium P01_G01_bin.54]